ncbi:MAG: T9SS C-terminal target domain-containing protein [Saprospirales bacterium]|nr:MAG: T9SS C-terminal target domain-containing protein [Saprospirales bacterium]
MKSSFFPITIFIFFFCSQLNAQEIIHYWHFNDASGVLDTVVADYSKSTIEPIILFRKIDEEGTDIGFMDDVGGTDLNAREGNEAGRGIRPRNPSFNGELFIGLSSASYEKLTLSYATERSGQGMLKQVLYYTIDGENFTHFGDTVEVNTDYELVTFDFSEIEEANDNKDFAVIIRFLEQNEADNGNNRFDNIVFEGTPIAEQEIIHYWHFNSASGVLDTVFADYFNGLHPSFLLYRKIDEDGDGNGVMDDVGGSSINARNDYEAGRGIRVRNPSINGELFISLNSEGFSDLMLSYASERSGSGMLKQVLYYTADGENYEPFGDTIDINTSYNLIEFDFSSIQEVENNPDFAVIIRFLEQNTADNGNNRLDNIVLEGMPLGSNVEGVVINEDDISIQIGESFQLTATILPPGASNQNISWRTENEDIATVNEDGLLTAISVGTTLAIVTTEEGGFEDSVVVEVLSPFEVEIIVTEEMFFIFDAEVTFNDEVQFTDAAGSVVFEALAGTFQLQIEKEGYLTYSASVEVSGDTILIISLTPLSNTLIHYWHFNNIPIGTVEIVEADYTLYQGDRPTIYYDFLPEYVDDPTMTIGYMDDYVNGSTLNAQLGHPAGAALRVRNRSEGRALIIELPTTNAENLFLSFDVHRSGQGMLFNHFEYTLDGENWQNDGIDPLTISIAPDYATNIIDFTAVEGANDNPDFAVRITFEGNTNQGNGNNRYDNVALFANIISSINENFSTGNSLKVFPNPTKGLIQIESEVIENLKNGRFQLYDLQGRLIRSGNLNSLPAIIDFSDVQTGLYMLVIQHSNGIEKNHVLIH